MITRLTADADLIVEVPRNTTLEEAHRMAEVLHQQLPGHRFAILAGGHVITTHKPKRRIRLRCAP